MSREIIFRAWDTEKKEMIYFFVGIAEMFGYFSNREQMQRLHRLKWMQCTGLKDKNGVEIYEGDVMREDCDGGYTLNTVQFGSPEKDNDICGWFVHAEKAFKSDGSTSDHRFSINMPLHWYTHNEVIGNIYENPELIKQP